MELTFTHHQSAHCENGVASNLLKNSGLNISEPMVFGIGSGLFFVYLPFIKVNYAPAISYRTLPGQIFNKVANRLNLKINITDGFSPDRCGKLFLEKYIFS